MLNFNRQDQKLNENLLCICLSVFIFYSIPVKRALDAALPQFSFNILKLTVVLQVCRRMPL